MLENFVAVFIQNIHFVLVAFGFSFFLSVFSLSYGTRSITYAQRFAAFFSGYIMKDWPAVFFSTAILAIPLSFSWTGLLMDFILILGCRCVHEIEQIE